MARVDFPDKADVYLRILYEHNVAISYKGTCMGIEINTLETSDIPIQIFNPSSQPSVLSLWQFEGRQEKPPTLINGLLKALAESVLEGDMVAAYALVDHIKEMR